MLDNKNKQFLEYDELLRILDKSSELICSLNAEGRYLFANQAFVKKLGKTVDQIIGKTIWNVFDAEDADKQFAVLNKTFLSGEEKVIELHVPRLDGDKHFIANIIPIIDKTGKVKNVFCCSKDNTKYKMTEAALAHSEQRWQFALEGTGEGVWDWNLKTNEVFYSHRWKEMIGYKDHEIANRLEEWHKRIHPEDRGQCYKDLEKHMRGEVPCYQNEHRILCKDGTYKWVLDRGKIIERASDGNPLRVIGTHSDINGLKELQLALEFEKQNLQITLESIGDGVISTDREGKINLLNRVAEQLTGWTQSEAYNQPFEEVFNIIDEITREKCENPVIKVLKNGETVELGNHTVLISKQGIERPIEDSAAPIKDKNGNINGVVLVFRDFTEKKERQERIEYLSFHDQLTGLYNHRFYDEELRRVDTERNLPLTLIVMDVNGLKLTNDAFGHLVGDKLLKKAAEVIKRECRADDIIARIGGDEFVILLPNTNLDEAAVIVNRIDNALSREKVDSIILSVSYGYETKQEITEELKEVFKRAEDNMYRRKLSESSSVRYRTMSHIIKTLYENEVERIHSFRVSKLCEAIGTALNLKLEDISKLRTVGLIHDIGKIMLDDWILNKTDALDDSEWLKIKQHSETGYRILSAVNEYSPLAEYVLAHHERWDGRGYPKGLKGEEIPLEARIIAIADTYETMTNDRPYRKALSHYDAIDEIKNNAGTQFDPDIARIFIEKVLGKGYVC